MRSRFRTWCIAFCISLGVVLGDSPAEATYLKNGVRAGDRSGLVLKRPPQGSKRFAAPRSVAPKARKKRSRGGRSESHAWFWQATDPHRVAAVPARWSGPLEILRDRRRSRGPIISRGRVQRIADRWGGLIREAAERHEVSEALILAVIAVESAGNAKAVSPKGATGLMQLMPATGRRFGVTDRSDPAQNIGGGTAYLDLLLRMFGGDVVLALAAYNAGENAVIRHEGVPPYAETRDYVVLVLDALIAAEPLCASPPDGPRRGCGLTVLGAETPA